MENHSHFRAAAMLLLCASLVSAVSCGASDTDTPAGTAAPETNAISTAEEESEPDILDARKLVSDDLPEKDFGGREFRIIAYDMTADDFRAEGETGALVNDVTYRRNLAVSERFNTVLNIDGNKSFTDVSSIVSKAITAGDDAFELISEHMITTANLAIKGLYMDWNEVPNVNVQKPWWNKNAYDSLNIAGKSYLLTGAISPYALGSEYCVYMNKNLGAEFDLNESIYDTVLDGKFTIDKYQSFIKGVYKDLNGNGKADEEDRYGLAAQVSSYATTFAYAFGETTVKHDADGIPHLDMNTEKWAAMVEKVYDLFYEGGNAITTDGWSLHSDVFRDGRALFMNGVFLHSYQRFTDLEIDYAILPYPKWDEAQERYYTMTDGSSPLVSIPITCGDPEFAGTITEALAAEAWKTIIPAVYDIALKVRGARDETSLQIIDMIDSGCVFDFGFVFSNNQGMGATMSTLMSGKKRDFAFYYAKNEQKWIKTIDKLVEKLDT